MTSLLSRLLALLLCTFGFSSLAAEQPDRQIALTIDDLPWQWPENIPEQELARRHQSLIDALRASGVQGVGFVNEGKLEVGGEVQPHRLKMMEDWLNAGWELGNHTWGHTDLHAAGLDAFQKDVLRGEQQLRPMLAKRGSRPRWFRHPYLRAGRTPADREALQQFLTGHGYRIAPVTVDNGEWVWAKAYQNVMDGSVPAPERAATLERLKRGYRPYMLNKVDYFERQSIALLGYALPQVWLLHANELNADAFPELIEGVKRRGYRIVTLEDALEDPAYTRSDGYRGRFGPSWLHRWAMAEEKPREFYAGEPVVPRWVLELAGVDSE